jgi:hypothetical protein
MTFRCCIFIDLLNLLTGVLPGTYKMITNKSARVIVQSAELIIRTTCFNTRKLCVFPYRLLFWYLHKAVTIHGHCLLYVITRLVFVTAGSVYYEVQS